jgi:parallel beta-helix repeat protein
MKMKRKTILVSLLFLVMFMLPVSSEFPLGNFIEVNEYVALNLSGYEVHDPIVIMSDEDFVTQGWLGNGILESPYVIENLSIDGMKSNSCIAIFSTSVYFVIRNCLLFNASDRHLDVCENYWNWTTDTACAGILLYNVTNGKVLYNKIIDNFGTGIHLIISDNNVFDWNECLNNGIGFRLYGSDNNTMINNTIIGGHLEERRRDSLVGIFMRVWYIWHEPLVDERNVTYVNSEGNMVVGNIFANHIEQNAHTHYCGFYKTPADTWPYNPNKWDDGNGVGNFWDDYNSSISDVYNITRTHMDENGWIVTDYEIDHFPSEYSIPENKPAITTTDTTTTTTDGLPTPLPIELILGIGGILVVSVIIIVYVLKKRKT